MEEIIKWSFGVLQSNVELILGCGVDFNIGTQIPRYTCSTNWRLWVVINGLQNREHLYISTYIYRKGCCGQHSL